MVSNQDLLRAGQDIWLEHLQAAVSVAEASGAETQEQLGAMLTGYLAAACGSGCAFVGREHMQIILAAIKDMVDKFEPPKPDLRVVK